MKHALPCLIITIALASCTRQGATLRDEHADTTELRVAYVPTEASAPLLWADSVGLLDSLGVCLVPYMSYMDIDTAIARRRVDCGMTAEGRLNDSVRSLAMIPERLYVVTARAKRLKTLKQLSGRTVAIDRLSNAQRLSELICDTAGIDRDAIFRPQVNDLALRTQMLCNALVEAAVLPEPYASEAKSKGNRIIYSSPDTLLRGLCLAGFEADERVARLLDAVDVACDSLGIRRWQR